MEGGTMTMEQQTYVNSLGMKVESSIQHLEVMDRLQRVIDNVMVARLQSLIAH